MKLKEPVNANYAATIVSIKSITPLQNCDNVVGTPLFGFQAIVSKDVKVGDVGVVFTAGTQLSEEFCRKNNLFRHGDKNEDESKTGYLEDNRRVKAMKFRGNRSDALFLSLDCLAYLKVKPSDFKEGDTFDELNGKEICRKFLLKVPRNAQQLQKNKLKFIRVDDKFLPKHYDTDMYYRNKDVIAPSQHITVTQKLHGTSIRIANTYVKRKLGWRDVAAKRFGIRVVEREMDYVYGSRNVVKDINNPNQNHFYGVDLFTLEGQKFEGILPENYIIYGELIGWTPEGNPIQKNYTYRVPEKTCDLYVYRIAFVNGQGRIHDLTWEQVKEFCRDFNLRHVPELWTGMHKDFVVEYWLDKNYNEMGYAQAVPLDRESPCDEGVCIRVDGLTPYILKAKSPIFYEHEDKMKDQEAFDLEEAESADVA